MSKNGTIAFAATRNDGLFLAAAAQDDGRDELSERIVGAVARYAPGSEVRWHESPAIPVNKGEVEEVKLVGFPEVTPPGNYGIAYAVVFPGPEGVGFETHDVLETELLPYVPIGERVVEALTSAARPVRAIADQLGEDVKDVEEALHGLEATGKSPVRRSGVHPREAGRTYWYRTYS